MFVYEEWARGLECKANTGVAWVEPRRARLVGVACCAGQAGGRVHTPDEFHNVFSILFLYMCYLLVTELATRVLWQALLKSLSKESAYFLRKQGFFSTALMIPL